MTRTYLAFIGVGILTVSAPVLADSRERAAKADQASDLDRVVCRRDSVAGSRVQTRRTCKTTREWVKDSNDLRERWTEFIKQANGPVRTN